MLRSLAVAERLQNADCSCEVALHPHLAEQGVLSDFSSHTNTQNATNTHKYTHTHTQNAPNTQTYFEMLYETLSQEPGKTNRVEHTLNKTHLIW